MLQTALTKAAADRLESQKLKESAEKKMESSYVALGIAKGQSLSVKDTAYYAIKGIRDGLLKTFKGNEEGLSEYGFKIKVTTSNRKAVAKKAPNT